MSVNKNNGLFEKIKKTVAARETEDTLGQESEHESNIDAATKNLAKDLEKKYKHASIERIKQEEQKFKQQLELAKEQYHKELKAKYSKVAQSVLQKREKELASKYQIQNEIEQKLQQHISKLQSELNKQFDSRHENEHKLQKQVVDLQQEIQQLQQEMQLSIGEAKINARQEQEKTSKALYEDLMQANRTEIVRQIEQKFQNQYLNLEADLKREHANHIKQQSELLLQDYEIKLRAALIEQEQIITQKYTEQLSNQSTLFDIRMQQEVATAVSVATEALQAEFSQERIQLQAIIDSLRPEVEANRSLMRSEIEENIRIEFSYKFEQLKLEMQQAKNEQLEALLTTEKQKLSESLQEENLIVLKYKEIEIREASETQLLQATIALKQQHAQQQQDAICDALQQQEQVHLLEQQQLIKQFEDKNIQVIAEQHQLAEQTKQQFMAQLLEQQQLAKQSEQQFVQQLLEQQQLAKQSEQQFVQQLLEQQQLFEQTKQQLQVKYEQQLEQVNSDNEERLQLAVMQEKIRVSQQNTNEKKVLLNQQQISLQQQFEQEKQEFLSQQQNQLQSQFDAEKQQLLEKIHLQQLDLQQLELKLTTEHQQSLQAKINQALMSRELELQEVFAVQLREAKQPNPITNDYELKTKLALQEQETSLRIQFASQLQQARDEWQQQVGVKETSIQDQLIQQEKVLRKEFQALLVAQRKQAEINYSKQLDSELSKCLNEYKQQITQELEESMLNDLASNEKAIKEKFEIKLKQQAEIARAELERIKQHLQVEQQEQLQAQLEASVAVKTEKLKQQYEQQIVKNNSEQEQRLIELLENERKKINLKFAQDKAALIKDLTARFSREKQIEMHKYETELRDKLYKEMVKQKDYIQQKFASTQQSALDEQKRRIQAQHKQEIERIKQGYFEPHLERTQHEQVIARRGVEQLADDILAKFQGK